ncbi:MAG: serine/threonine protein kinase [Bradymonadales bacterium]|nr:serine/threonine protein kinase [Bradymonadales bacterium]
MDAPAFPLMIESADSPFQTPGWLGKYLLWSRVAKGGMADIYIAEPRGREFQDAFLAIKLLLSSLAKKRKFVEMFRAEGKLGLLLLHPNIVKTIEVARDGPHHFIAMEFVDGQDLGQIMRFFRKVGAPVPVATALYIAQEILNALGYAHDLTDSHGRPLHLVNRDVSPANVMIGYDGSVRLIDFGIAQAILSYRNQIGSIKGKIPYMSPEQVRGLAVDARSDLFSLGTILYEMLSGVEPFKAPTEFEQMERVRQANLPPLEEVNRRIDRELSDIVSRALAKEPADRFQTAGDMLTAIQNYAGQMHIALDPKELHQFMVTEFADQRAKLVGQIEAARDLLRNGELGPDTDPTDPSPRRPPITSVRSQGKRSPTGKRKRPPQPRWLLPAVIAMSTLAVALLALALLRC